MIRWTDSHAHLYNYDNASLLACCAEAREHGVVRILNAATSLESCRTVVSQCSGSDGLFGAVGISPFDVAQAQQSWEDQLSALASSPGIIAIGETGIDTTNPSYPDIGLQLRFFEKHLALAHRLCLTAIVHSRGCEQKALDLCIASGIKRAVFHCYTGTRATMEAIVDAGHFVSFSGIVTFAKTSLASIVKAAPLGSILIETDTPYLAPVPHRGKPNRPAWAELVGKKVAEIKGIPEEELAAALERNFERAFGPA
jgi:TatD DNase family protein